MELVVDGQPYTVHMHNDYSMGECVGFYFTVDIDNKEHTLECRYSSALANELLNQHGIIIQHELLKILEKELMEEILTIKGRTE